MLSRTLILGGGFGGLTVATELRRRVGADHEIVVVDRSEDFYVGLRKLWVLVGSATLRDGTRARNRLAKQGIRFVEAEIERIDAAARRVETSDGALEADHLVIALGAEPRADLVPGMLEAPHAFNLFDPVGVAAASERLRSIARGHVAVVIAALPYKCPPAPYEATMLVDAFLRERGVRDDVSLSFATLQPMLLPNAGVEGARWVGAEFDRRDIHHATGRQLERITPDALVYGDGARAYDIALVVAPHRPPAVIAQSGLGTEGPWVKVDRHALETVHPGVYAIGDVVHIPLGGEAALPKAGVMAEGQGLRVAMAIAAKLEDGAEPGPFDGTGECYIELGGGQAAYMRGNFYAPGGPDVKILDTGPEFMEAKRRFETERLERWLG